MSQKTSKLTIWAVWVVAVFSGSAWAGELMWVQAAQTDLKDAAQMSGKKVAQLKRGDPLEVITKQGTWIQVRTNGHEGWVSKLFVSDHKPVGNADLTKDVNVTMEKTSRRRSSSYAVSASTRGLNTEGRTREGRSAYPSDYGALKTVDDYQIDETKMDGFKKDARMGGK